MAWNILGKLSEPLPRPLPWRLLSRLEPVVIQVAVLQLSTPCSVKSPGLAALMLSCGQVDLEAQQGPDHCWAVHMNPSPPSLEARQ